ncbi:MAG TPA: hypothetical protein VK338_06480 [Candidatus Nitrosocosmicus sp.]|nr:hypothetical protein [Candidatus Nitrosocosmicus sp.]
MATEDHVPGRPWTSEVRDKADLLLEYWNITHLTPKIIRELNERVGYQVPKRTWQRWHTEQTTLPRTEDVYSGKEDRLYELESASELGFSILSSLAPLHSLRIRLEDGNKATDDDVKIAEHLHSTLDRYNSIFPNPINISRSSLKSENCWLGAHVRHRLADSEFAPKALSSIEETILKEFNLPTDEVYPTSIEELIRWSGAPEQCVGLRFLPGFRKLNFRPDKDKGIFLSLAYEPGISHDRIRLQTQHGREFYIASTHGLYGVEHLLESMNASITVNQVVPAKPDLPPYVIFDRDGTLTSIARYDLFDEKERKYFLDFKRHRYGLLREMSKRGIPFGVWTRATSGDAQHLSSVVKSKIRAKVHPAYDFGNWPGLYTEGAERSHGHIEFTPVPIEEIADQIDGLSDEVKNTLQEYCAQNFGEHDISQLAVIIHDYLQYCLTFETRASPWHDEMKKPFFIEALEAKIPLFAAIIDKSLTDEERVALITSGVLVNDARQFS